MKLRSFVVFFVILEHHLFSINGIRKAEPEEWGVYCSVYYNMRFIGFFREESFNAPRRNSFWIYKGESKIGGVRMGPNSMYQRALTGLKDKYPVLRLYVMEGNDAESVYLNLGFVPGVLEIQSMYIPTNQ
ncbi:hypothetical protein GCM10010912_69130 [Paenibacillus albidus]|uniref:Uncharacterized protein n=1 Tax=Paenibacillus albidus TaxID=2041023 RepID=A0A917FZ43_9BACL|nr:hypothetical protein [Paenibacillus albidus]GGG14879.1 hypothetical protein GCM10010912_69130 [Paenibacillus albidus]